MLERSLTSSLHQLRLWNKERQMSCRFAIGRSSNTLGFSFSGAHNTVGAPVVEELCCLLSVTMAMHPPTPILLVVAKQ